MTKNHRVDFWRASLGMVVWLGALPSCAGSSVGACDDQDCEQSAQLKGTLNFSTETRLVTVEYCGESKCTQRQLDLADVGEETDCGSSWLGDSGDGICFKRVGSRQLELTATLTGSQDGRVPPDGTPYRLTLRDDASGDALVDETREADYVVTLEENCPSCWAAEMAL